MTIDDAVAQCDTFIYRRMLDARDRALLDMVAAGIEQDEAEAIITIHAEHYESWRPAMLAEVRRMLVEEYPSGVIERLTFQGR